MVKSIFHDFYAAKFKFLKVIPIIDRSDSFAGLTERAAQNIQKHMTEIEIREAVWSCGSDHALGPAGFSFRFINKY